MHLPILSRRKLWFALSGALIAASLACTAIFGLNFGIDFTGGSLVEVRFENPPSVDALRQTLQDAGYGYVTVQTTQGTDALMRLEHLDEAGHQALLETLRTAHGSVDELRFDSIGPSIGAELRRNAVISVVLTLVLIGIYVAWAFRKVSEPVASWKYAVLTVLTAFHDVIIPVGVFAVLGRFFGWQVDTTFVAAVLTILGYSINDTIVVFDRTRENLTRPHHGEAFEETVERSIKETLTRSFNTGFAALLALAAISIWGGETTRPFALALIIGIAVGTYSSIFIASPLLVEFDKWTKREKKA
ncbi:protein translocase subunit SecF [Candidatus Uhrbacteria bacterium]|nr:protein translocase subunit SecF [Candidatus Uhrbacteria bacterium]